MLMILVVVYLMDLPLKQLQNKLSVAGILCILFCYGRFQKYVTSHCAFTTRASLTGKTIAEYQLAVPSIEKQQEIVNVLNKFHSICNDLSAGLPAEIEARQKQYEYYRDKLLSFKELPK